MNRQVSSGDRQKMPELLNKVFSVKVNDKNLANAIKNPMIPCFQYINEICIRFCGKYTPGNGCLPGTLR